MKKIALLLVIVAALPSFTIPDTFQFSLVGRWKSSGNNDAIDYLIFEKDGHATMQKGNETIGGKNIGNGSQKGKMTYSTNFSAKPAQIDFILTRLDTQQEMRIKGIVHVIIDIEIKVAINNDPTVRPKSFDASAMLFKRAK